MSSARKRAAIQKANAEAEHLRQRLGFAESRYSVMKLFAETVAREVDGWRKRFPGHEYRHQDGCVALKLMAPSSKPHDWERWEVK